MKEAFENYLLNTLHAILFVVVTIVMMPVMIICRAWQTVTHFCQMVGGCASHDLKGHLMFWTWEDWGE